MIKKIVKNTPLTLISILIGLAFMNCKKGSGGSEEVCAFIEKGSEGTYNVMFLPKNPNSKLGCNVKTEKEIDEFISGKMDAITKVFSKHSECKSVQESMIEEFESEKKIFKNEIKNNELKVVAVKNPVAEVKNSLQAESDSKELDLSKKRMANFKEYSVIIAGMIATFEAPDCAKALEKEYPSIAKDVKDEKILTMVKCYFGKNANSSYKCATLNDQF
ncbi:MAG: hypothetical protein JJT78_03480 [Leptospira sp.]|nr:hypothetical protein [Leptospira sp.]